MAVSIRRTAALAAVAALMAACGGGGGDNRVVNQQGGNSAAASPAPAPAGAPAPAPAPAAQAPLAPTNLAVTYDVKAYNLSWNAAASATSYDVYEDPDGPGPQAATRIATGATATSTTVAIPVLLDERIGAEYTVRACNSAGCSAQSAPLQPDVLKAIGVFTGFGSGIVTRKSVSLSADGLTMAVAGSDRSSATGINGDANDTSRPANALAGAVFVLSKVNGSWVRQAYVKAPGADTLAAFGAAVALSGDGNTLAVTTSFETLDSPTTSSVEIYTRSGGTWTRQGTVRGSNTEIGDRFGLSLAFSRDGNTLVVGADSESSASRGINQDGTDNAAKQAGAAYVFTRAGATWSQQAYLKASNADAQDFFGSSIAVSGDGNTVVIGAPGERSRAQGVDGDQADNSRRSGAAYVFQRTGTAWAQAHYLKASNSGSSATFGFKVGISADASTIVVSSPHERSASQGINGSTTSDPATQTTGVGSGAAWVFVADAGTWKQQAYIKASNAYQFQDFGRSVGISKDGNVLAVASGDVTAGLGFNGSQEKVDSLSASANPGAVFLFRRTTTTSSTGATTQKWTQTTYVKTPTISQGFGLDLDLASDGTSLAVRGVEAAYLY